eukprot:6095073-Amphidinium_carterae.1
MAQHCPAKFCLCGIIAYAAALPVVRRNVSAERYFWSTFVLDAMGAKAVTSGTGSPTLTVHTELLNL